jgi:CubicO group peptidase (beta-lactamase class C family)
MCEIKQLLFCFKYFIISRNYHIIHFWLNLTAKRIIMKKLLTCLVGGLMAFTLAAQTPAFINDSLDSYILKGLKDWDIPGLSIVIVKDGKPVIMKGYGVRDIEKKEPVDQNTLFMIASNTKLFTGTALALLETRGKLNLNDKVTRYFPGFRLYDTTSTQLVTIRDMLTHRIGTKTFQGDFTFWNTKLSRSEIMKKMRLLKPSHQFRQDYGYCNSCFLTAGEVIPKITSQSWESFIRDSITKPLGMNNTMILSTGVANQPNVAVPYTTSYTGKLNRVSYDNWNNLAPAASIVSTVNDLSHWLMMQLDSGQYNGTQILPWQALQKTRDINIVTNSRKSSIYPMHIRGYGLGLNVADYNGRQVYWHTGGAGGMVSNVCFVPEENLGIAILTNNDNQNFFELLRYQVLDAYLGMPFVNRSLQQLDRFKSELQQQVEEINAWRTRIKGNKPELQMNAYAGVYTNELNGDISISQVGDKLRINFTTKPDLTATLSYMDNGEWLMEYNNIEYGIFAIQFKIEKGRVKSVTTKQNEFVEYDPYTYRKK